MLTACSPPGQPDASIPGTNLETPAAIDDPTVEVFIEDDTAYIVELQTDPNQLVVQVIPGNLDDVAALASAVGATVAGYASQTRTLVLHLPAEQVNGAAAMLSGMPEVEAVEKQTLLPVAATPADPFYPYQWHLPQIHAEEAWDISTGSDGITVAIIDSGIDTNHPDLRDRLSPGYNLVGHNSDASDCCGHGTQVAGMVGTITNNALGIAGATWSGRLMPVRVAKADGASVTAKSGVVAEGMVWAVDHGADILNVSFSGVLSSPSIQAAAQYAYRNGRLVVAAMGNSGERDSAENSPWCLSVSATDMNKALAVFSTFGPGVDLAAPGDEVVTTLPGGAYGKVSGTSFSAPLVAGVAALAWSLRPEATPDDVASWLAAGATPLDNDKGGEYYGGGMVDAFGAVNAAMNSPLPPDTTPPTVQFTSHGESARLTGKTRVDLRGNDDGVVYDVTLSLDGREVARDLSAPYAFLIDTQLAGAGPHSLSAVATDAAGNRSAATAINVAFDDGPDDSPPIITMESPSEGQTLAGRINIVARLADPAGLQRVTLLLDGHRLVQRDLTGSGVRISVSWNASGAGVVAGFHTLTITATNRSGLVGTASRTVTTRS